MNGEVEYGFQGTPTIADRVALGCTLNRIERGAVIPFPPEWKLEHLPGTFKQGADFAVQRLRSEGYVATKLYLYHDDAGNRIAGVLRLDHPEKRKQVLPVRATEVRALNPNLELKAIDAPRPLYGLHLLAQRRNAPVLITEGEKAADAGTLLLPDYVVITWSGGAQSIEVADWRPLADRNVTIWPDHDTPGWAAAAKLASILQAVGVASVRIVITPPHFPSKWDVADPFPVPPNA